MLKAMSVTGTETSAESSGTDADLPADSSEETGSDGSILEREPIDGKQSRQVSVAGHFFSGPLPPPAILKQYNEVQPDFAERLLKLTEGEAAHRRELARRAQEMAATETRIGQIFGLVVALAGFATSAWLGSAGLPGAASAVGGATIVGLVSVFITGRRWRDPDSDGGAE